MLKVNFHSISQCCQRSVNGIEQCLCTSIILWSDPFCFQYTPKRFNNVHVRRVRRQIEQKKPSIFPYFSALLYFFIAVDARVIQYNECLAIYSQGDFINELNKFISSNTFGGCKSQIVVIAVNHSKYIQPLRFCEGI